MESGIHADNTYTKKKLAIHIHNKNKLNAIINSTVYSVLRAKSCLHVMMSLVHWRLQDVIHLDSFLQGIEILVD